MNDIERLLSQYSPEELAEKHGWTHFQRGRDRHYFKKEDRYIVETDHPSGEVTLRIVNRIEGYDYEWSTTDGDVDALLAKELTAPHGGL